MKTIKICGVTVTPRWDWSPDYLKCVRHNMKSSNSGYRDRSETAARKLAEWVASRSGIELKGVNKVTFDWQHGTWRNGEYVSFPENRISTVRFYHENTPGRSQHFWSGGRWREDPNFTEPDLLAEITIPHWDATLSVSSSCYDDDGSPVDFDCPADAASLAYVGMEQLLTA